MCQTLPAPLFPPAPSFALSHACNAVHRRKKGEGACKHSLHAPSPSCCVATTVGTPLCATCVGAFSGIRATPPLRKRGM